MKRSTTRGGDAGAVGPECSARLFAGGSLSLADDVERAACLEPFELVKAERVGAAELKMIAGGRGDATAHWCVGGKRGEVEDRDAVVLADHVVRSRIGEPKRQH